MLWFIQGVNKTVETISQGAEKQRSIFCPIFADPVDGGFCCGGSFVVVSVVCFCSAVNKRLTGVGGTPAVLFSPGSFSPSQPSPNSSKKYGARTNAGEVLCSFGPNVKVIDLFRSPTLHCLRPRPCCTA